MKERRKLIDLVSVGEATVRDFEILGIREVDQLVGKDAEGLYRQLCEQTKSTHDPCVIDIFSAAIAQAENLDLSEEKKKWWYWSRLRKSKP